VPGWNRPTGPGNLHLINGLFYCHRSRVPVLAIAAQVPSAEIGAGYFQETHPETLFKECSHYCELISGANQMPRTLEIAIRQAVGNRGVSVVVIPGDVALHPASDAAVPKAEGLLPGHAIAMPPRSDVDRLAALLNNDGRVTMLCGSGCQGPRNACTIGAFKRSALSCQRRRGSPTQYIPCRLHSSRRSATARILTGRLSTTARHAKVSMISRLAGLAGGHPQQVAKAISDHAAADAIITCDVGLPTVWAARYLKMNASGV